MLATFRTLGRQTLLVGSVLLLRGIGSMAQFLLNIVLGRVLGAEVLGVYYIFTSWVSLFSTIGGLGLPLYTLRTVSSLDARKRNAEACHFVVGSLILALGFGTALAVIVSVFSPVLANLLLGSASLRYVFSTAAVAGVLLTALRIFSEALKARSRPNLALAIEFSFLPLGLILFVGLTVLLAYPLAPANLLRAYTLILLMAASFAGGVWFEHSFVRGRLASTLGHIELRRLKDFRGMWPFWGMAVLNVAFVASPFVFLPFVATPAEVGQFGVAYRLVALATVILTALASFFAPRFAKHATQGNAEALARDFRASQLYALAAYLPLFVAFTVLAGPILSIFGEEFYRASLLLRILAVGQLIYVASGLAGDVLNMVRFERIELLNRIGALLVMLVASLILGRLYGVVGLALAYALSLATRGLISLFWVLTAIGRFRKTGG